MFYKLKSFFSLLKYVIYVIMVVIQNCSGNVARNEDYRLVKSYRISIYGTLKQVLQGGY